MKEIVSDRSLLGNIMKVAILLGSVMYVRHLYNSHKLIKLQIKQLEKEKI
jgi:hypothetical protein